MTDETGTVTPEERREARIERWQVGALDEIERLRNDLQDLGDRLAEKDADITGLRSLIEAYEHKFVAKNAEIERLTRVNDFLQKQQSILVHERNYDSARADKAEDARADERRRTAEEIKRRIGEERDHPRRTTSLGGRAAALNDARLICDEVGGSDGK